MYYFEKYNSTVLLFAMILFSVSAIFVLRKKVSSLIDPLIFHMVWCASALALLSGYFFTAGLSIDGLLFVSVYICYIGGLYMFLGIPKTSIVALESELNNSKNTKLFIVCLFLNLASRYEFFSYALSSPSLFEWFLYRFKQFEGRSVPQYILQLGARPFFLYYIFILLKTKPNWRPYLILLLIFNVLLDVVAGGRSSIISLLLAYGYFVHRFLPLFSKSTLRKLNRYGIFFVLFALVVGATVTSLYKQDSNIQEGGLSIVNRLLAAGDGLEMYLVNNGSENIESGIGEYIKSIFGIYIKRVVDIKTQSIGWKLYELENGVEMPFAVGPNYILPLQAFVLGKFFIVPYSLFISFLVAFLRGNYLTRRYLQSKPLSFVLGLTSFEPALDIELFVLVLIGCLSIYFIFILPVRKVNFSFKGKLN